LAEEKGPLGILPKGPIRQAISGSPNEFEPHLVAVLQAGKWSVERRNTKEEALEVYFIAEQLEAEKVYLAKIVREHAGRHLG